MDTPKPSMWPFDVRSTLGAIAGIALGWISAVLFSNPSLLG